MKVSTKTYSPAIMKEVRDLMEAHMQGGAESQSLK